MVRTILISGGTGLVGKQLVHKLLDKGYKIHLLVRGDSELESPGISIFKWDVYKRQIDPRCITGVDAVIHLAGESIAGKRWTDERKQQIIESRTASIGMIYDLMRKNRNQVNQVISASAVGYYGDRKDELLMEDSLPSKDFLAETCIAWEEAVDQGEKLGVRIVKLRSGIILSSRGGVLQQMEKPLKLGFGVIPGSGKQWISWIHMEDALGTYIYALENESMRGVYNMVAPEAVSVREMTHQIASAMHKSPLFIHIPELALKVAIGDMSLMALESTRASADKLERSGYSFKYRDISKALANIYTDKAGTR